MTHYDKSIEYLYERIVTDVAFVFIIQLKSMVGKGHNIAVYL